MDDSRSFDNGLLGRLGLACRVVVGDPRLIGLVCRTLGGDPFRIGRLVPQSEAADRRDVQVGGAIGGWPPRVPRQADGRDGGNDEHRDEQGHGAGAPRSGGGGCEV